MFRMKTIGIFSTITAVLFIVGSCTQSGAEVTTESEGVEVTYSEAVAEAGDKYVATLAIEGMACEMMCGNKIATTLNGLEGVRNTEIDFEGEGQINSAIVEYDNTKLTEKEMIEAVHGLVNGHYKVKSVNVTHHKVAENNVDAEQKEESKGLGYQPALEYKLPNIFGVFSRLF